MATNLHRVLDNYAWRIGSITGLASTLAMPTRFIEFDPIKIPEPSHSMARQFYVELQEGAENTAATDASRREAEHLIVVNMLYPAVHEYKALQAVIAQDIHLLDGTLRRHANHKGYNASNKTTDIGLYRRQRTGYVIDRKTLPGIWLLKLQFVNKVRETE